MIRKLDMSRYLVQIVLGGSLEDDDEAKSYKQLQLACLLTRAGNVTASGDS